LNGPPSPGGKKLSDNCRFQQITAKAQTTMPKEVRSALGVKPGDTLVYRISKGKVSSAPSRSIARTSKRWNPRYPNGRAKKMQTRTMNSDAHL
jgi:bifunctional DNA-binding transcriptional regulator/antitoxin component of YhaV-PrlF toxin-antitoxin module